MLGRSSLARRLTSRATGSMMMMTLAVAPMCDIDDPGPIPPDMPCKGPPEQCRDSTGPPRAEWAELYEQYKDQIDAYLASLGQ